MQESNNPSPQSKLATVEFIVGQHSLFFCAFGQAFFYLHQFKPYLPVWIAGPFFMLPWAMVFIIFFHDRPLFSPQFSRRCWLYAACGSALFTVIAEMVWISGNMPPPNIDHRVASDVFVQILMNLGWLSFLPMLHDYHRNPNLWKQ